MEVGPPAIAGEVAGAGPRYRPRRGPRQPRRGPRQPSLIWAISTNSGRDFPSARYYPLGVPDPDARRPAADLDVRLAWPVPGARDEPARPLELPPLAPTSRVGSDRAARMTELTARLDRLRILVLVLLIACAVAIGTAAAAVIAAR
jgi:hypothetical protein